MPYSGRHQNPIGASDRAMGGAATNMGVEALAGDTDMVTVFDDFNHIMPNMGTDETDGFEECGWTLAQVGAADGEVIGMNNVAGVGFNSCLMLTAGADNDTGSNAQLDMVNADLVSTADELTSMSGRYNFPHIWLADSGTATALDNTVVTFGTRIGLLTTDAAGAWDGKVFIGFAEAGDAQIMTSATGVITIASTGALVGFHIPEDGSIDAVSHRTAATVMAEGTNFTEMLAAGAADSTTANGAAVAGDVMWFDLAFRMDISDMSDDDDNGITRFYYKRVPSYPQAPGTRTHAIGGDQGQWVQHGTSLTNQTPNSATILVPTIELQNGATETEDITLFVDWWAMGISRYSRQSRQA